MVFGDDLCEALQKAGVVVKKSVLMSVKMHFSTNRFGCPVLSIISHRKSLSIWVIMIREVGCFGNTGEGIVLKLVPSGT